MYRGMREDERLRAQLVPLREEKLRLHREALLLKLAGDGRLPHAA